MFLKMKKILITIIALLTLSLTLTSCNNTSKKPPTTVTVWTYYNGAAKNSFDLMVDEFNTTIGPKNNIIIDAYTQGDVNQLADAVLAAANEDVGSDKMPHIFASYPESALVINRLGLVADMEKYFSAEELAEYRTEFVEGGRLGEDNSLKIIPIAKSSECIFLNKTDYDKFISEAGIAVDTSTWEGLAATAKKYYEWTDVKTDTPNDGKALLGIDSMANFMIIATRQLGLEIYRQQGDSVSINFPKNVARRIWDNYYVPFVNGHYAAIGRFRSDDAKTGDVLAYAGSTAGAAYFPAQIETGKDISYPIECAVYPYPHFKEAEPIIVEQGAGMVIAKSDSTHEKAAALFLKWFTEKEQNLKFAVQTGYLPVKNESLSFDAFKESFDTVSNGVENKIVLDSAKTAFDMLDTCTLYSTKPFEASYDARKVLENSLLTYAKDDLAAIDIQLSEGGNRTSVIAEFVTDTNFENWYQQFMLQMTEILKE